MKSLYKGKVASLVWFILSGMPTAFVGALCFKFAFITLQVISGWLVFIWFFGNVSYLVSELLPYDEGSYLYPMLASSMLLLSAFCSLLSRMIALKGIRNLLFGFFFRGSAGLGLGDYKGVVKVMLAIIDSFVPIIFILLVFLVWIYHYPLAFFLIPLFIVVAILFLKLGVVKSIKTLKGEGGIDKEARALEFYKILMLPQYITVAVYSVVALFVLVIPILLKEYSTNSVSLDFIFILSIFAVMQLKSSVGAIVRVGAYYGSVKRLLEYIKQEVRVAS